MRSSSLSSDSKLEFLEEERDDADLECLDEVLDCMDREVDGRVLSMAGMSFISEEMGRICMVA